MILRFGARRVVARAQEWMKEHWESPIASKCSEKQGRKKEIKFLSYVFSWVLMLQWIEPFSGFFYAFRQASTVHEKPAKYWPLLIGCIEFMIRCDDRFTWWTRAHDDGVGKNTSTWNIFFFISGFDTNLFSISDFLCFFGKRLENVFNFFLCVFVTWKFIGFCQVLAI